MKVLLDVCTPVQVRQALSDHDARAAVKMGWGELENGDLLRVAESAGFDLLIICDISRISLLENSPFSSYGPTIGQPWKSIGFSSGRLPKPCDLASIARCQHRNESTPTSLHFP